MRKPCTEYLQVLLISGQTRKICCRRNKNDRINLDDLWCLWLQRRTYRKRGWEKRAKTLLAGRNEEKTAKLAADLGLSYRSFNLECPENLQKNMPMIRMVGYLRPLLNLGWLQSYMKKKAGLRKGPNEEKRKVHKTLVWGEAKNDAGKTLFIQLETANGYDVTVDGPLAIVQHFFKQGFSISGSVTPSKLMGPDFICTLPGSNPQGELKIQQG